MKKLWTGTFAIGLMMAAVSCGSSATKTSDATTATVAASATSGASATTAPGTPAAGTAGSGTAGSGGLTATQAQVLADGRIAAANAGVILDEACFTGVIAQLTEADAKLIVAAGPSGSVTLSSVGEALGAQAAACASDPSSTTDAATATT